MSMKANTPAVHKITEGLILSDVERFLQNGGKIKKIPIGKTGIKEVPLNRKHINTSGFKKRKSKRVK